MKTILITAIGGDIAQAIAVVLGDLNDDFRLLGADIHEQHAGNLFVDDFFIVPEATDSNYENKLNELIHSEAVDIVIPTSESELEVWSKSNLKKTNVSWLMNSERIINICNDKLETIAYLESIGIDVPWTMPVSDGDPKSLPCIMKDRYGRGSRNVFLVEDKRDSDYLTQKYKNAIYQELLLPNDKEITCCVYRTMQGDVHIYQMNRRLVRGLTSWVETIDNQEINRICKHIAVSLNLRGSINIQLRLTAVGSRIFEINPRFSSTALIRHRLGFCDVKWAIDESLGRDVDFSPKFKKKKAVRIYDAALLQV